MTPVPVALSTKDNASGQLNAGISASALSIVLKAGNGANFPQPYTGSATSLGTAVTLNSTGILAVIGSGSVGKYIWNKTDGSIAVIKAVATNVVTTTRLLGGTTNLWNSADVWCIDPFVATFATLTSGAITTYEEALVTARSTDTLTVSTGGRGYNGTTANTFSADDYVYLFCTSPILERLKDLIAEIAKQQDTDRTNIANFSLTTTGNGASLVGVEDAGNSYAGTNVESVLAEVATSLASKVGLTSIGLYGDGTDGVPSWTSGASLNPSTEKRYTTATIPVSQTVGLSSSNTPLVLHNSGNVTINGTLDVSVKGGAGGAGVANNVRGLGGTAGNSVLTAAAFPQSLFTTNPGAAPAVISSGGAGGGGGGSIFAAGAAGAASSESGGAGGAVVSALGGAFLSNLLRFAICGAGGSSGNGGVNAGATGGAGGAGGGAVVWMIGGNLTLGASSVLNCSGSAGSKGGAGAGARGGGGGGGSGGGMILILVAGTITNSGATLTAGGGAAGSGTTGTPAGANGGAGAAGNIIIYSLSTGTMLTA